MILFDRWVGPTTAPLAPPMRSHLRSAALCLAMVAFGAAVTGCRHDHEHAGDSAHAHDGAHGHGGEGDGLPAESVTVWTERTELFMEYEPLIVGKQSRFAAHITRLPEFVAATEGKLTVEMRMADGTKTTATADAPASKGIFRVVMQPPKPGACTLTLRYEFGGDEDPIDGDACVAHPDEQAARKAAPAEEPSDGIAFSKEQQWQIEFENTPAAERELQPSIRATAEIQAVPSRESRLTAPVSGRVALASPTPIIGSSVDEGQVLASILPSLAVGTDRATLDGDIQAAEGELRAAEAAFARVERLLAQQAVPERSVEEARARLDVARARAAAAKGRLSQFNAGASGSSGAHRGSFLVRSTLAGTLVASTVAQGQSVTEGEALFQVVDLDRVWLSARIFEPDLPKVGGSPTAWFTVDGVDKPFDLADHGGKLVTVGHLIDPKSRTAPAIFELDNPDRRLRIGQFAQAYVATGDPVQSLAIPQRALLDDGGRTVVFVQLEGELFSRRVVRTGVRAKGWVQVLDGVRPGERVVSRGAYQVRLAAASGAIPQHGHVH